MSDATAARAPDVNKIVRAVAFALTWTSYAAYYFGRKGISVAKAPLTEELGKSALYGVETAYLAAYAVGQYASGLLGDRVGARRLVGLGMLASAAACFAFGVSSAPGFFLLAFLVNGLAQSTGWPGNVKAMAEWTTPENRGAVMGVWSTCYQVGGIAATALAARLLSSLGWRAAFWGPALGLALVGALVLLFLKPGPGSSEEAAAAKEGGGSGGGDEDEERRIAQRRVLRSPTIWSYGASYFCIKLIRYSLLFWLPFYLKTALGYSAVTAGYMSTSFEVGGVVGTIAVGFFADRVRTMSHAAISAASLVGLAGALYLYVAVGTTGQIANVLVMALVGSLLFGPDSLLSGAAAQDAGGPRASAIAAGIINGIGSVGAILQEVVTRGVSDRWGWSALFYVFLALALLSAASLVPAIRRHGGVSAVTR